MKNSTIKQSLKATRTTSTKELAVIAHFGNCQTAQRYLLVTTMTVFVLLRVNLLKTPLLKYHKL